MDPYDELIGELIGHLEEDSGFDVDAFLEPHEASASEVRAELERMARQGLIRLPGPVGRSLTRAREQLGLRSRFASNPTRAADITGSGPLIEDRFEILEEIGAGGMARVLRAFDRDIGRDVALKLTLPPAEDGTDERRRWAEQFIDEARITGELEHPVIPPVHEFGIRDDGSLWFAMKLVAGKTLRTWIDELDDEHGEARRELPLSRRVEILLRLTDALAYAHDRGILHLDLKPGNVMVGPFGEVQLMDWGLATRLANVAKSRASLTLHSEDMGATSSGEVFGTPSYMAPEQALGRKQAVGPATDVFGLGALGLHLLGGLPPYRGADMDEVLERARSGRRNDPSLSSTPWSLPRELRAVLRRALEPDPRRRYAGVAEFAKDLRAYERGLPGLAWRDGIAARVSKWVRRHPTATTAFAGSALLTITSSAAWSFARSSETEARLHSAEQELRQTEEQRRLEAEQRVRWTRLQEELHDLGVRAKHWTPSGEVDPFGQAQALAERLENLGYDLQNPAELGADVLDMKAASQDLYRDVLWSLHMISVDLVGVHEAPEVGTLFLYVDELVRAIDDDPWRLRIWSAWTAAWMERSTGVAPDRLDGVTGTGRSPLDREWLGWVLDLLGQEEACSTELQAAVIADPSLYWTNLTLGNANFRAGRMDVARRHYHQAVASEPRAAAAFTNLCNSYRDEDRRLAREYGLRAVELGPENPRAHLNLGLSCWDLAWEHVNAKDVDGADVLFAESARWLGEATALGSNSEEALWTYGRSLAYAGDSEGVAVLERAAEQAPSGVVFWELGSARRRFGDSYGCCEAWERALVLDPGMNDWRSELAYVLNNDFGHVERALAHLAEAERRGWVPAGLPEQWRADILAFAAIRIGLVEAQTPLEMLHALETASRRAEHGRCAAEALRLLGTTSDVELALRQASSIGQSAQVLALRAAEESARCWRGEGYLHEPYAILLDPDQPDVVVSDAAGRPLEADRFPWDGRRAWKNVSPQARERALEQARTALRFALHLASVERAAEMPAILEELLALPGLAGVVPAVPDDLDHWLDPLPADLRKAVRRASNTN